MQRLSRCAEVLQSGAASSTTYHHRLIIDTGQGAQSVRGPLAFKMLLEQTRTNQEETQNSQHRTPTKTHKTTT